MKNLYTGAATALALALSASPASAAEFMFDFTTSAPLFGPPVSGSGIFTTSDTAQTVAGNTAFSILSITGMVNGSAITVLMGAGFGAGGTYGNYFTTGPGFLDGSGTRFFTASGLDVRFFLQSSGTPRQYRVNTFGTVGSSNFVNATSSPIAAAVPEPSTWAMLILGFGLIGAAVRNGKRTVKTRLTYA